MAYIQVHQSLLTHRKTLHLASLLSITPAQTIGHLICLWCWALDNAPSGSLSRITPSILALACQWPGDPQTLLSSLADSGFLDTDEDGDSIHDWFDYAGRLIATREAAKRRTEQWREKRKELVMHNVRITNAQRTDNVRSQTRVEKTKVETTTKSTNVDLVADKSAQMPREDQTFFKILSETIPFDPASLTTGNRGKINAAIKNMRTLTKPVTVEELPLLVTEYQLRHPDWEISATAIAENVYKLRQPRASPSSNGGKPRIGGRATDAGDRRLIEEMQRAERG